MSGFLRDILKNWEMEQVTPVKATNTGAAIATGIWHLGEKYSLKTGNNFEGLRQHIHISRVLQHNGISASCPLVTQDGEDFLTCGDHYYVITERITDNFLSIRQTPKEEEGLYFERYAQEVRCFDAALRNGDGDFAEVIAYAESITARTAGTFEMPWNALPSMEACASGRLSSEPSDFFVCATKVTMSPRELVEELDATNRLHGLLAMLTVFVAWTAGQPSLSSLIRGNLRLAAELSHGFDVRVEA